MTTLKMIAAILLIVGGLNWGLVGLFDFDLVRTIFGSGSILTRLVYVLVGIAAVVYAVFLPQDLAVTHRAA